MRRALIIALLSVIPFLTASSQNTWGLRTGIGAERKIAKGFDAGLEFNYHQADNFRSTDRWSVGVSLSKRLYRNEAKTFNVKAGLGYKFLNVYQDWSTKYKGKKTDVEDDLEPNYYIGQKYDFNYYDSYVDVRHRITASLQASVELGNLKISFRESYQFTHSDSIEGNTLRYRYVPSDKEDDIAKLIAKGYTLAGSDYYKLVDGKSPTNKNVLRSKIGLDYNIPHWKYDPFLSYELFNSLDNAFEAQKSRITAGVEFSFKKKHNFELAYMWQNQHDDDEPAGSFICIDYQFSF